MPRLVLFGPGYTGSRIVAALGSPVPRRKPGSSPAMNTGLRLSPGNDRVEWQIDALGRSVDVVEVREALARATHIVSTVPPAGDEDPILAAYGAAVSQVPWIGYLSSTGVYGDTGGAWVDERAPLAGRRGGRIAADLAWQRIGARVFRLPGIYGPGRSALERVRAGEAHRVDLPDQVFSRIHVDDIVGGVLAAIDRGPAGVYNLADDLPASQNDVVAHACRLLGLAPPPLRPLDALGLSAAARAFYSENRRIANGKARRLLGWRPRYSTYREGLAACFALSP